jgi:hypothetical protein
MVATSLLGRRATDTTKRLTGPIVAVYFNGSRLMVAIEQNNMIHTVAACEIFLEIKFSDGLPAPG